jgi:photosystem II stability/assembly factor-like uncharacterized protein
MKHLAIIPTLLIFISTSHAQTWQWQNPWPTNYTLMSVQFVNDSVGWSVGHHGTICHTTDGGQTWPHQAVPTWNNLYDCAFASATTGWAVGEWGTILHTTDAGETWVRQEAGFTDTHITGITYADEQTAWACCLSGRLLRTTDGGDHWIQTSVAGNINVHEIVVLSRNRLLASADTYEPDHQAIILSTTDGGANWINSFLTSVCTGKDIAFSDSLHGWMWGYNADGSGQTITLRTTDGGITWPRWSALDIPWISKTKFLVPNPFRSERLSRS